MSDNSTTEENDRLTSSVHTESDVTESRKTPSDWFLVVLSNTRERAIFDKSEFATALRARILDRRLLPSDAVDVHLKGHNGEWSKRRSTFAEFAKGHFELRVLFEPVWSHAMTGLKWGHWSEWRRNSSTLSWHWPPSIQAWRHCSSWRLASASSPRIGMIAVAAISFAMFRYSKANFFMMGMAAAAAGAALGCMPGMAVGGLIGLIRKSSIPRAPDAQPEPGAIVLKACILPLLGGLAVAAFYLYIFNPWLASKLG